MRYDQISAFAGVPRDDDLCHCGRLKRFANCCKFRTPRQQAERIHDLTLVDRSKLTVEATRYFLFSGSSEDPYAVKQFTPDRVSQFYRYLSDLWPHRLRALDTLRGLRDPNELTGFYVGDPRPETILQNISRLSLYTDRILVPQPFYMPWSLREDYDPVAQPGPIMQDTRKWAVLTLLLQPWIYSGMIVFVPDPSDFDQALREAFLAEGKRREAEGRIHVLPEDLARYEEFFKADFLRQLYSLPDDEIVTQMRRTIGIKDDAVPALLEHIHAQRQSDPLYIPGVAEANPLMRIQIPTIEQTLLSCGLTGAFPFTDRHGKWREIREHLDALPPDAEVWSPLTRAFGECRLEFLNIADTRLSFAIREQGYLASFRSFMRSLWKAIDGSPDERAFPGLARDMADRLRHEHGIAAQEWKNIHSRHESAIRNSAVTSAFAGISTAMTSLGLLGVALSFASHTIFSAIAGRRLQNDMATFRAKIPMSIFIDLTK